MLFGYKIKWMVLICWIGIVSIQNRNPIIYQGGDDLLRMLLFWSFFLPLNKNDFSSGGRVNTVATMAILCQILLVFLFSGIYKNSVEWWHSGSAIYFALKLDQIARPLGISLNNYYPLTVFLTRAVYILELAVLPLFLFPFYREHIRFFIFLFLLTFNLGIISCMMIGIFPLCFLAASVLFISTTCWEKIDIKLQLIKNKISTVFPPKTLNNKGLTGELNFFNNHWIIQSLLGFFFTLVLLWNTVTLPKAKLQFPIALTPLMIILKLDQSWGMFAPTVLKEDGWLVAKAEFYNGSVLDLFASDLPLSYAKPASVLAKFKNDRWRKFTEQIVITPNNKLLTQYAQFLVSNHHSYASDNKHQIKKITIIFMRENSRAFGQKETIEKLTLYEAYVKKI